MKKTKDLTFNFRLHPVLDKQMRKRAKQLDLSVGEYITVCLIYDIRFGDATEYVKQCVKDYRSFHFLYPGIDKKADEYLVKQWREKQRENLINKSDD